MRRALRAILMALVLTISISLIIPAVSFASGLESVYVQKYMSLESKAIVVRSNGEMYLLDLGIGDYHLSLYEGRNVYVYNQGFLFAGIGSKILIPDRDYEIKIWNSTLISNTTYPRVLPPLTYPTAPVYTPTVPTTSSIPTANEDPNFDKYYICEDVDSDGEVQHKTSEFSTDSEKIVFWASFDSNTDHSVACKWYRIENGERRLIFTHDTADKGNDTYWFWLTPDIFGNLPGNWEAEMTMGNEKRSRTFTIRDNNPVSFEDAAICSAVNDNGEVISKSTTFQINSEKIIFWAQFNQAPNEVTECKWYHINGGNRELIETIQFEVGDNDTFWCWLTPEDYGSLPGDWEAEMTMGTDKRTLRFNVISSNTTQALANVGDGLQRKVLFTLESLDYRIGDSYYKTDVAPYANEQGRTMLPLRVLANALNITDENIMWNSSEQSITIFKEDHTIHIAIGNQFYTDNGIKIPIDTTAIIKDGRTLLPLRAIAQALGVKVTWDPATKSIAIDPSSE